MGQGLQSGIHLGYGCQLQNGMLMHFPRDLPAVHHPALIDVIDADGARVAVIHGGGGGGGRRGRSRDGCARGWRARRFGKGRPGLAIRYTSISLVSTNQNSKCELFVARLTRHTICRIR